MDYKTTINGLTFEGCIKGKTFRIYRQTFGRDLLLDYEEKRTKLLTSEAKTRLDMLALFTTEWLEQIGWVALKTVDPALPDLDAYVDELSDYDAFIEYGMGCFEKIFTASMPAEPAPQEPVGKPKKKVKTTGQ